MFRELPRRGWALVAGTVAGAAGAIAAGAGIAFLAMVAFGFLIDEAFHGLFSSSGWDAALRAGVGVTALVIVGALGVCAVFVSLARLATAEQLARAAEREPAAIPGWSTRQVVESRDPFGALVGFAIIFLIVDAVAVLLLALALGETFRDNPESAWEGTGILAVLIALGGATVLAVVLRRRSWQPRFADAVARARAAWEPHLPTAYASDRERRRLLDPAAVPPPVAARRLETAARRGLRIGGPLLAAATAICLVTLFARQPCRFCDERRYGDAGEATVDVLAQVSAAALGVATLVMLLAVVAGWASRMLVVAHLTRRAETRQHPAPDADSLAPAFAATWPLREAGLALVAFGGGVVPLAVTGALVGGFDAGSAVAIVSGAVGVAGVVLLATSESHAARARTRMRDAWAPGDLRPPAPRRRVRASRSGRS